jgi:hypothetical protein
VANRAVVDAHERLVDRISREQDDVLASLQLVRGDAQLEGHLWARLVGLLVEGLFVDLRGELLAGRVDRDGYAEQLAELAERCRSAGLLPLPVR